MNSLITREHNGAAFTFREDGYFNMTKAAQHFGKRLEDFWKMNETREYSCIIIEDLYSNHAISRELSADARAALHWYSVGRVSLMTHKEAAALRAPLVETSKGHGGGTWAHPKLAVFFARWLKPAFGYWCDKVIADILYGRSVVVPAHQVQEPAPSANLTEQMREEIMRMIEQEVAPLREASATIAQLASPVIERAPKPQEEMVTVRDWLRKVGAGDVGRRMAANIGYDVAAYCRQNDLPIIKGISGVTPNRYSVSTINTVVRSGPYSFLAQQ